jgi:hypothetical protein
VGRSDAATTVEDEEREWSTLDLAHCGYAIVLQSLKPSPSRSRHTPAEIWKMECVTLLGEDGQEFSIGGVSGVLSTVSDWVVSHLSETGADATLTASKP